MERTLIIVKPNAYAERAHIRTILEHEGFTIVRSKDFTFTPELAKQFYQEHAGRSFFDGLIEFTTSGPVEAMELERVEAVSHLRRLMGDTYPERARPGTLRALFGQGVPANGTHGSDSPAAAAREIALAFDPYREVAEYLATVPGIESEAKQGKMWPTEVSVEELPPELQEMASESSEPERKRRR